MTDIRIVRLGADFCLDVRMRAEGIPDRETTGAVLLSFNGGQEHLDLADAKRLHQALGAVLSMPAVTPAASLEPEGL